MTRHRTEAVSLLRCRERCPQMPSRVLALIRGMVRVVMPPEQAACLHKGRPEQTC